MTTIADHRIPTATGTLALVLHHGSTCYDLVADSGAGPVTVYLSNRPNQRLQAAIGDVITAMDAGEGYEEEVFTDAGVTDRTDPEGWIRVVYSGSSTFTMTVDDRHDASALVNLSRDGGEALLLAAGRMVSHL